MAERKKTRTPVTTRRGDGGYTSLWGGDEVAKYDPRVEATGILDEACALVGEARTMTQHSAVRKEALRLQNDLYRLMSEISAGEAHSGDFSIDAGNVTDIEGRVERIRDAADLPAMFTISATPTAAVLDVARTVIRRGEREVARMLHQGTITNAESLRFLNRASDLAFVLARFEEKLAGVPYQTISAKDLE
ncbi:MAG TPA: cob(I)yrinic acid a,c-diamide adenosyltransferase [Candidatus Solibacter sp.]|jgi:cob(I)alamin adenosyltransferase|nr:cob(I)yrinic acid a,c-diamide adenosyltransferase [Candidatus Solibacter sp.]